MCEILRGRPSYLPFPSWVSGTQISFLITVSEAECSCSIERRNARGLKADGGDALMAQQREIFFPSFPFLFLFLLLISVAVTAYPEHTHSSNDGASERLLTGSQREENGEQGRVPGYANLGLWMGLCGKADDGITPLLSMRLYPDMVRVQYTLQQF